MRGGLHRPYPMQMGRNVYHIVQKYTTLTDRPIKRQDTMTFPKIWKNKMILREVGLLVDG